MSDTNKDNRKSPGTWHRKGTALALLLGIAIAMSIGSGCGKSDPRLQAWGGMSKEEWLAQYKQRKEQEAAEAAAERAAANAKKEETVQSRKPRSPGRAKGPDPNRSLENDQDTPAPAASPAPPPTEPPKTEYPADAADWTPEDFRKAWEERSPRLPSAISTLGSLHVGDPAAAEKLGGLLELILGKGRSAPSDPIGDEDAIYIRGICLALSQNRTAAADEILVRAWQDAIVRRDAPAIKLILESVVTEENAPQGKVFNAALEDLVRLATTADSQWIAEPLSTALRLSDGTVREAVWQRFADQPDSPLRQTIIGVITRSEEADVRLLLDVITSLPPEVQAQEWKQALDWSTSRWRSCLQTGRHNSPYHLVSVRGMTVDSLWRPAVAEKTCRELDRVVFLRDSRGPVKFAAMLPMPEVRARLLELLRQRWSEPPEGVFAEMEYTDPGLITVLKLLLKEHQDSAVLRYGPRPVTGRASSTGGPTPRLPREMPVTPAIAAMGRVRVEYQAWLDETYANIDSWMNRLGEGVPLDRQRTWDAESLLGFSVHSKTCPGCAASMVLRPTSQADEGLDAKPLVEVVYVRLVDHAAPRNVVAYYRRMLPLAKERPLPHGLWLDHLVEKEKGLWNSVDVRVKAVGEVERVHEEQDLLVEILWVKAGIESRKDPTVAAPPPGP